MGYGIFILSVVIVTLFVGLQFEPTFGQPFYNLGGVTHGEPRVTDPVVFTAVIPALGLSLIAAFIGLRAIGLYGGKLGEGLIWMVAGFIFLAGIILMELPSHLGFAKYELVQNTFTHAMQVLAMISIIIGLQKITKLAR